MVEHIESGELFLYYIQCGVCAATTVDLQRHCFLLAFDIPVETSNFDDSAAKLLYTTAAVDCRQYRKTYKKEKIGRHSTRERHGRTDEARLTE